MACKFYFADVKNEKGVYDIVPIRNSFNSLFELVQYFSNLYNENQWYTDYALISLSCNIPHYVANNFKNIPFLQYVPYSVLEVSDYLTINPKVWFSYFVNASKSKDNLYNDDGSQLLKSFIIPFYNDRYKLNADFNPQINNKHLTEQNYTNVDVFNIKNKALDYFYPDEKWNWFNFNDEEFETIVSTNLFNEYRKTQHIYSEYFHRKYPLIELYVYLKVLGKTLKKFDDTDIEYILVGDLCDNRIAAGAFIYYIIGCRWFGVLSDIYQKKGLKWFYKNFNNNQLFFAMVESVVIYSYVFEGITDCKKFKIDLLDIYKNALACSIVNNQIKQNQQFLDWLTENIQNLDDINYLQKHYCYDQLCDQVLINLSKIKIWYGNNDLSFFKQSSINLDIYEVALGDRYRNTFEILNDTQNNPVLFNKIQKERNKNYYDIIEQFFDFVEPFKYKILSNDEHIILISPYFKSLSEETVSNIKSSLCIYRMFNNFVLAMYPIVSSLERELKDNFILPFTYSEFYPKSYTKVINAIPYFKDGCNINFSRTCEQLKKRVDKNNNSECITLGSYKFFESYLDNYLLDQSDNILKSFSTYLAENLIGFKSICSDVNSWKIPKIDLTIPTLRNCMMHGNSINNFSSFTCKDFETFWNFWINGDNSVFARIAKNSKKTITK